MLFFSFCSHDFRGRSELARFEDETSGLLKYLRMSWLSLDFVSRLAQAEGRALKSLRRFHDVVQPLPQ